MSVWKSDEKLLIFTSFHQQMKHLKVDQKYSAALRIFHSLLSVLSCLVCYIKALYNYISYMYMTTTIVILYSLTCLWTKLHVLSAYFVKADVLEFKMVRLIQTAQVNFLCKTCILLRIVCQQNKKNHVFIVFPC